MIYACTQVRNTKHATGPTAGQKNFIGRQRENLPSENRSNQAVFSRVFIKVDLRHLAMNAPAEAADRMADMHALPDGSRRGCRAPVGADSAGLETSGALAH
jgi:hypothetical protein